jgi:hypothetical protein
MVDRTGVLEERKQTDEGGASEEIKLQRRG